jgi:hypothetical protein
MKKSFAPIEWKRLLIEGLVIVFSILLAFSIDAWWDGWRSQQAEVSQLRSVAAELESTLDLTQTKLETLAVADAAAVQMMSWMGPQPRIVEQHEFAETFRNNVQHRFLPVAARSI